MSKLKIIVCVKQVLDSGFNLEINSEKKNVTQIGLPSSRREPVYRINPADHFAFETAMELKDKLNAEVLALTLGPQRAQDVLRLCLARGADRAIHLECPPDLDLDSFSTSQILSREIANHNYDLILCGNQSLDTCDGIVGPLLAELLNLPQVTRAVKLELSLENARLRVIRLMERGERQVVQCQIPALVTVMESMIPPTYISNLWIRKVSAAQIETRSITAADKLHQGRVQLKKIAPPRPRPRKISGPESGLSASERMKAMLVDGSRTQREEEVIFKGAPDDAAERIIHFLRIQSLLD